LIWQPLVGYAPLAFVEHAILSPCSNKDKEIGMEVAKENGTEKVEGEETLRKPWIIRNVILVDLSDCIVVDSKFLSDSDDINNEELA
jgi:hypothetical protein